MRGRPHYFVSAKVQRERARWAAYHRRLISCYGPERAMLIYDGEDEAAEADLAKWNQLGVDQ